MAYPKKKTDVSRGDHLGEVETKMIKINADTRENIKSILFSYTDSKTNLSNNTDYIIYRKISDLLPGSISFDYFKSAFSIRFMSRRQRNPKAALNEFIESLETFSSPSTKSIDKPIKKIKPWPPRKNEFKNYRAVADALENRNSEDYLSDTDRALISEKSFLRQQGIEDDEFYVCRIMGFPYEWVGKKEGFKDFLSKTNEIVVHMVEVLNKFLNDYMPKLINENGNARKWVIDFFGSGSAQWIPDWQTHVKPRAFHKGTFKKSYPKMLEYLQHRDISRIGYKTKNAHLFWDNHWIRGRILLLAKVYGLLFGVVEFEKHKQRVIKELGSKIRELFKAEDKNIYYRYTIEHLYFEEFPDNAYLRKSTHPVSINALMNVPPIK